MAASCRRMTRGAGLGRSKGNVGKNRTRYNAEQGARNNERSGRHRKKPKCSRDVKNGYVKEHLRLRSERTSSRYSGNWSGWRRSRSELPDLPPGHGKWGTGHCGGVDPLRNVKRDRCSSLPVSITDVGPHVAWPYFQHTKQRTSVQGHVVPALSRVPTRCSCHKQIPVLPTCAP
jgi:hypothetical protein